jgi:UDP-N-acetylmuramoyl-tripeptide--D-alanyl-D-alanine ligase
MAVALDNFFQLENKNKIAVLGDMFELGEESSAEHQLIVQQVLNNSSVTTYFIGKNFYAHKIENEKFHFFLTFDDFSAIFKGNLPKESLLLIKGSRGMALEKTLEILSRAV